MCPRPGSAPRTSLAPMPPPRQTSAPQPARSGQTSQPPASVECTANWPLELPDQEIPVSSGSPSACCPHTDRARRPLPLFWTSSSKGLERSRKRFPCQAAPTHRISPAKCPLTTSRRRELRKRRLANLPNHLAHALAAAAHSGCLSPHFGYHCGHHELDLATISRLRALSQISPVRPLACLPAHSLFCVAHSPFAPPAQSMIAGPKTLALSDACPPRRRHPSRISARVPGLPESGRCLQPSTPGFSLLPSLPHLGRSPQTRVLQPQTFRSFLKAQSPNPTQSVACTHPHAPARTHPHAHPPNQAGPPTILGPCKEFTHSHCCDRYCNCLTYDTLPSLPPFLSSTGHY